MAIPDAFLQPAHNRADRLGRACLKLFSETRRISGMSAAILAIGLRPGWLSRPAVTNVAIRQIYFTGVQGLVWVIMVALGVGVLAVYNIVDFAKNIQDMSLIGMLISNLLVQEIAPLLVTILLLSRSGVAMVTELGTMHVRGEDLTLRSMGISIQEYLLWPRLMAFTLCGLILTFVFVFVSIWLGGLLVSLIHDINFIDFLLEVRQGTSLNELVILVIKGSLYPMLGALILLDRGCHVGREPNLIPVRATQGVLGSLIVIIMSDAVIALLQELL